MKSNFLFFSTLLGGLLFSYIFWEEWLALNQLIYSIFIIAVTIFNPEVIKSTKFKFYMLAHLLAAILVVINNSTLTTVTYFISLVLFVGFAHYQAVRTIYVAALATAIQMITIPVSLIKRLSDVKIGNFNLKPIFRPIKYIILPLIILLVFTGIYSGANQVFAHYLGLTLTCISDFFNNVFGFILQDLSLPRFFHFCLGTMVTGGSSSLFIIKVSKD
ncbi:hypothetical protein H9N25_04620 [Pedobacter riviphilus]|uniref:YhhN-like protein n=1 Tax=Pedobacter riviphilus TaxID=2766984 RepID=A0ABX6TMD7_9SPHI|nr:hypothetical protein [Pedobacter riviphilus]QNR85749.1 hypothetical protein H9N25_04620 [Pedobacter riviphilus]